VAFDSRDNAGGSLNFSVSTLSASFTASNSVQPGGIHPKPGQTTGGNGLSPAKRWNLRRLYDRAYLTGGSLFLVPQVLLDNGDFLWLSASRPIVAPGTPFAPDLQSWTRDEFLDPDWLRIGTDIVGARRRQTFNMSFSLNGTTDVPEPGSMTLFGSGLAILGLLRRRKRKL